MKKRTVRRKKRTQVKLQTVPAWSYSRWQMYSTCAAKLRYAVIDKHVRETSEAAARGIEIHKAAEMYVDGECAGRLHPELTDWEQDFIDLHAELEDADEWCTEGEWAFSKDWDETDWFAKNAWFRAKMDVAWRRRKLGCSVDYKTGKIREEHEEQAELYAVALYARHAEVSEVEVRFWYFDESDIHIYTYEERELVKLQEKWNARGVELTTAKQFPYNPGYQCRWCDFRASAGGPCPYGE